MSLTTGKVISVGLNVDYPKKDGTSTYSAFILKYMTDRNEVREKIKPMQGLKYPPGPAILAVLQDLKPGDTFSMLEEKKGDYLEIKSLVKGGPSLEMAVAGDGKDVPTAGKVVGSNYETAAERKTRQRLIVRQSSFAAAERVAPAKSKIEDLFAVATEIEAWVYRDLE